MGTASKMQDTCISPNNVLFELLGQIFVFLWQVRKTSQAALLVLLEQELIERYDVETKVCPVLIDLTAPDSNDDVKTEAVAVSNSNIKSRSRKFAWMLDSAVVVVCF